jgi:uncharacterized YigZ family protein
MPYVTPQQESEYKLEVKNSRFIGKLSPASSQKEADAKLLEIKNRFSDATHNCWAYRILEGDNLHPRWSDEGEPSGTAGKPILESLEERDLCNALLVVTRYFGGIKIGRGGLSRAYRETARGVIANAVLQMVTEKITLELNIPFSLESHLRRLVRSYGGEILEAKYSDKVIIKTALPKIKEFDFKKNCN